MFRNFFTINIPPKILLLFNIVPNFMYKNTDNGRNNHLILNYISLNLCQIYKKHKELKNNIEETLKNIV